MPDRWDLVEDISGIGRLTAKDGGETVDVRYRLQVYRKMLYAGQAEFIPGPLRIEGNIWKPADELFGVRSVGKYFTVSLTDGRKLDFFFRDQQGSVANSGRGLYSDPA